VNIEAAVLVLKEIELILILMENHFVPDFEIVGLVLVQNGIVLVEFGSKSAAFRPVFAVREVFPLQ
jgi:hypothetical protein